MLIQAVMTAGGAFAATNVDDILILSLFCARLRHWRQALPLFLGKTLGFSVLVLISLLGLLGTQLLAPPWLGLLGLVPISLGILRWRQGHGSSSGEQEGLEMPRPTAQPWAGLLTMAGLTLANGADNIGVYLPLFARSGDLELVVTLATFAVGLALLGLLAWGCSRTPGLASLLSRLGEALVPLVLIVLGSAILLDGLSLDRASPIPPQGVQLGEFSLLGLNSFMPNSSGPNESTTDRSATGGSGLNQPDADHFALRPDAITAPALFSGDRTGELSMDH